MKKGWKIFWVVCVSLTVIGLICCAASFALGVTVEAIESRYPNGIGIFSHHDNDDSEDDWEEDREHEVEPEQSEHTETGLYGDGEGIFDNISSVDAEIAAGEVEIRIDPMLKGQVKVVAKDIDERLKFQCFQENRELKITTTNKISGIVGAKGIGKIYLYVPSQEQFEDFSVDMLAGRLYIEEVLAREFSVDMGAGEAEIAHFTASDASLQCGTGSITASGNVDREVEIECGMGEISYTATGKETDYNYEINCGVGEVKCGPNSYSGLGTEKSINNQASKEMSIDCGVGAVTVKFAEQL